MFSDTNTVGAVELGTSKICVLIGRIGEDGSLSVIGSGECPSDGAVVKGEISDMKRAVSVLRNALELAEEQADSDIGACQLITVVATGGGITSSQELAAISINTPDGIVSENEKREVSNAARNLARRDGREIINTCTSSYTLDRRRCIEPRGQAGKYLQADVHIVSADTRRLDTFIQALRQAGLEDTRIEPVFTPLVDTNGSVDNDDQQNGFILIDLGAGTTEYLLNIDGGVRESGVLQVGMEHVANDLAIGLSLPIDKCRRLLSENIIATALAKKDDYIEIASRTRQPRRIPLSSCERIIDARLNEIFYIIRQQIPNRYNLNTLGAGGLITGGGALYPQAKEIFSSVFDISTRVVTPLDVSASMRALDNPRYSAIWGALKIAPEFIEKQNRTGVLQRFFRRFRDKRS